MGSIFKNKTLLITGGTGSFGNAVLNRFIKSDIGEIRIFSRDEKKQDDMRHLFQAKFPEESEKLRFFIGDVRDLASVRNVMYGLTTFSMPPRLNRFPAVSFFRWRRLRRMLSVSIMF